MAIDQKQLVGMQRAEFARASRLRIHVLVAQLLIMLISASAIFEISLQAAYFTAVAGAAAALYWVFAWNEFRKSRSQAERARRATLLMEGLGERVSSTELSELEASFSVSRAAGERFEDENYYATLAQPGDKRLAEMLDEASFFSCHIAGASARVAWTAFFLILCCTVLAVFAAVPFSNTEQAENAVRIFCAILTLLVSIDVVGAALGYSTASNSLVNIRARLDSVRARGFPQADLLLALCDYNSTVEGAPMFVPGIYAVKRDEYNELWNKHLERLR